MPEYRTRTGNSCASQAPSARNDSAFGGLSAFGALVALNTTRGRHG